MISDEALYNEAIAPEYPKPSQMLEGRKWSMKLQAKNTQVKLIQTKMAKITRKCICDTCEIDSQSGVITTDPHQILILCF